MKQFNSYFFAAAGTVFLSLACQVASAQNFFDNTVITSVQGLTVNRAVYDSSRDLIYATVPSSFGFPNGNSLAIVDPNTSSVVNFINAAGSEPNAITISGDNSVVYFGVDGANAFRSFDPVTNALGTLQSVNVGTLGNSNFGPDPAVVEDIAVQPGNPNVVIVSADETGSSASGVLQAHDQNGLFAEVNSFRDSNSISFLDSNTLVTFNNSSTGFDLQRFNFDGANFNLEQDVGGVVGGFSTTIESASGLVYASSGTVVDPTTLTALGTFGVGNGPIEPAPNDGLTYFFDGGDLEVFDNASFLQIDVLDTNLSSFSRDLFFAGEDRLAVVDGNGQLSLIDGVVFSVPEPSSGTFIIALLGYLSISRRRQAFVKL